MCRWCDAEIGGSCRLPGSVSGAGGLPGASVVAVGAVLLLLLSPVSGCSPMLLCGCTQGCWVPCLLLCLFPPPPCALGVSCRRRLFEALFVCSRSCVVGPRSWAGSPSWTVPFGVSCCCLRCYTCSQRLFVTHVLGTEHIALRGPRLLAVMPRQVTSGLARPSGLDGQLLQP